MNSVITYCTRIFPKNKEEFQLLYDTMLEHQKVWNHMSHYTFKTKNINKKLIHDSNYHECRKLFPNCPSQIIIRAKDSVYATYKTAKSNHHLNKMDEPAKQTNWYGSSVRSAKGIVLPSSKSSYE